MKIRIYKDMLGKWRFKTNSFVSKGHIFKMSARLAARRFAKNRAYSNILDTKVDYSK